MPSHSFAPPLYHGVMISSTFKDLIDHRAALSQALGKQELHPIWMEQSVPRVDENVNTASLRMVRNSSAYIGLIGKRYGQIVAGPENPNGWSVTRLEFEEALKLGRPILIFVMGKRHLVEEDHIDFDPELRRLLEEFRERAKTGRIYVEFNSPEDFQEQAIHAVARLATFLATTPAPSEEPEILPTPPPVSNEIPPLPKLYAKPEYAVGLPFVGRREELRTLSEWSRERNPDPVLLFDAIGGSGKSMLTWQWVTEHAREEREWAGIFWYSFYEEGATLAEFLRHALAYCSGRPLEEVQDLPSEEVVQEVLRQLRSRPFLFVLDGLERVLVAYHRADASKLRDDEIDEMKDTALGREPCDAIRPSDGEFLRKLATIKASKILISTRLVPNALVGKTGQAVPGVRREILSGLRPDDALALFRSGGVSGDEGAMADYLARNCDGHPLVVAALAGVVSRSLACGDFDAWLRDEAEGGKLDFTGLDLVQRKNHIVEHAIESLEEKDLELLRLIAILPSAADAEFLRALNPHLPPEIPEVERLEDPREGRFWNRVSEERQVRALKAWEENSADLERYEREAKERLASEAYRLAPKRLAQSLQNLVAWGLLQRNLTTHQYDLHPVVRGVAAGTMDGSETARLGQGAIDHFSSRPPVKYEQVKSLSELADPIRMVKLYQAMGRWAQAASLFRGDLSNTLKYTLEEYHETLGLYRPFYGMAPFTALPGHVKEYESLSYIANDVAICLGSAGMSEGARQIYLCLMRLDIKNGNFAAISIGLQNLSLEVDSLYQRERLYNWSLELARAVEEDEEEFSSQFFIFSEQVLRGDYERADRTWEILEEAGFEWSRHAYRQGSAEYWRCRQRFQQGALTEEELARTMEISRSNNNRFMVRQILALRGKWHLRMARHAEAKRDCEEAIMMARSVRLVDEEAETLSVLVELGLRGDKSEIRRRIEELEAQGINAGVLTAEVWEGLGEPEKAGAEARKAYQEAWNDGEPYVYRYHLDRAKEILTRLGAPMPELPPFDPNRIERFEWEDDLVALIEKKKAEPRQDAEDDLVEWDGEDEE
ncbi:MAG: DUF4062 domain-containing protein [Fimbriimonas sp.]